MGFVDWLSPGRKRRNNLALSIDGVADAAREVAKFDDQSTRLWDTLCDASRQTLHQMLVSNDDRRLDWGLKSHTKRISDDRLVVLFWWMLVFQLVLLRLRGVNGRDGDDCAAALYDVAMNFVETEFDKLDAGLAPPEPWSPTWDRKFTLEATMDFYNKTYELLGLKVDQNKRIEHVSHFTSIAESAYDRLMSDRFP